MPYSIVDETTGQRSGSMHDAARPFVVVEDCHGSYRDSGRTRRHFHGRYESLQQAKRRKRWLETGR